MYASGTQQIFLFNDCLYLYIFTIVLLTPNFKAESNHTANMFVSSVRHQQLTQRQSATRHIHSYSTASIIIRCGPRAGPSPRASRSRRIWPPNGSGVGRTSRKSQNIQAQQISQAILPYQPLLAKRSSLGLQPQLFQSNHWAQSHSGWFYRRSICAFITLASYVQHPRLPSVCIDLCPYVFECYRSLLIIGIIVRSIY